MLKSDRTMSWNRPPLSWNSLFVAILIIGLEELVHKLVLLEEWFLLTKSCFLHKQEK